MNMTQVRLISKNAPSHPLSWSDDSGFSTEYDRTTLIHAETEFNSYDGSVREERSGSTPTKPTVISLEERRRLADHREWLGLIGFKILKRLDANQRSQVYLAWRLSSRRPVVVKTTPVNEGPPNSIVSRFKLEARLLSAFTHPNLVKACGFGRIQKIHYMLLEYVEGPNFKQLVRQRGPLPVHVAAQAMSQAAAGLGYAHTHRVIHRDVKPANLVLDSTGHVKVLDLGLARVPESLDPSLTLICQDRLLGTPDFMAPEQIVNSHVVDARTDVYGLGCTLYYLLAGFVPFAGDSLGERLLMQQTAEPLPLEHVRRDVPRSLSNVVARMMSKRPADRYPSMAEVREALAPYAVHAEGLECSGR